MDLRLYSILLSIFIIASMFTNGLLTTLSFKSSKIPKQNISFEKPSQSNTVFPISKFGAFNILILGGDETSNSTDTIILSNIDLANKKLNFLSIPRDTKITNNQNTYKINSAYQLGGSKKVTLALNDLLGVNINYYVHIDTQTFANIINSLGGVEISVPEPLYYEDPTQNLYINLPKGRYVLDGEMASSFVRFRKFNTGKVTQHFDGSDLNRITNQQILIKELIDQKITLRNMPKLTSAANILFQNLDTDISSEVFLKIINSLSNLYKASTDIFTLKGTVRYIDNISYFIAEEKSNQKLISEYFNVCATK